MWYRIIRHIVLIVLVVCLTIFGVGCILLYKGLNHTVYDTPFGRVDVDTLKVGLLAQDGTKPCYFLHRDIKGADTLTYYFQPSIYYYMVVRDSLGQLEVWEWDKYSKTPYHNVTNRFEKNNIIIR